VVEGRLLTLYFFQSSTIRAVIEFMAGLGAPLSDSYAVQYPLGFIFQRL
jgi:hypothetical protein